MSQRSDGQMRIGSGSVGAGDQLAPGAALAASGLVDYMGFDALAERTLALAQVRRTEEPTAGHDERLVEIVRSFAGYLQSGGRIVGNFGAANVESAARIVVQALIDHGLPGVRVGVIRGDDVLAAAIERDVDLPEWGCSLAAVRDRVVSAHAYIGAEGVAGLLEQGADFVIGGRLADPSVWVGAICHELGWPLDDWDRVARATLVGHLLEGGVGRAPGEQLLPTGYPYAIVSDDRIEVTKLENTGGPIDILAAKRSLAHEIHDPRRYLTPDVTADFSDVWFEEVGPNRVVAHGATGRVAPSQYRILVGLDLGWKVIGEASFAGPRCVERARQQAAKVESLLSEFDDQIEARLVNVHGVDAVFADAYVAGYPADCRVRIAVRVPTRELAETVANRYWQLYGNGGGGVTRSIERAIGVTPAFMDRRDVDVSWEVLSS